ncbi:hypothetical protein KR018_009164, partial [Drosophila ironensis]
KMRKKKIKSVDGQEAMDLVSEDEWMARTQRYLQRLSDFKTSVGFINDAREECVILQEQQVKDEKWAIYLACDGLPVADQPAEIRKFIFQLRTEEKADSTNDINWALAVNERSILTQDLDRVDLTRTTLTQTVRSDIGKLYEVTVQRILETNRRIGKELRDQAGLLRMSASRAMELAKMPAELIDEVVKFYDKLSYRVISAPEAYMTNEGCLVSYYCYNATNFNIQIWSLQDVPIRFQYLQLPLMHADMNCVGITVQLPLSVLEDNLCLRCVHSFFDPYSHLARSYNITIDPSMSPSCGLMNMEESAMSEWIALVDIQEEIMQKVASQMKVYEDALAVVVAESHKKGKDRNSEKLKKLKIPKKPQQLPEGMLPDPYKIYLAREKKECSEFFSSTFDPSNINLLPHEVNLRRYIIMGGVFSLVFLHKPKHTAFEKVNISIHEDNRTLRTHQKEINMEMMNKTLKSMPSMSKLQDLNEEMARTIHHKVYLRGNDLPYYMLDFTLPTHLCEWGQPMVCQFIEEEIQQPEDDEESFFEDMEKKQKRKKKISIAPIKASKVEAPSQESKTTSLMVSVRLPTVENASNIYNASALDVLRQNVVASNKKVTVVKNFNLKPGPLGRRQVRCMQEHFLPRIISSFKFPQEFQEDDDEEQAGKKASVSTVPIHRRRPVEAESAKPAAPYQLSYSDQANPERVYPIFPDVDEIIIDRTDMVRVVNEDDPDETFDNILDTLDRIKSKYEESPIKMIAQTGKSNLKVFRRQYLEPVAIRASTRSVSTTRRTTTVVPFRQESNLEMDVEKDSGGDRLSISDASLFKENYESAIKKNRHYSIATTPPPRRYRPPPLIIKHWTTQYILNSDFNHETKTLTVKTDRLGEFGFAYPRYTHFPFTNWQLEQDPENVNDIIFTLDTQYVRVVLILNKNGIRGHVIDIPKPNTFVANPLKYLEIKEPISDFVELRKRLQDMNLNVFAELDASFYIDQGYFSLKHLAAELHTYNTMAVHCKLMKFMRNDWNRLATGRDLVLSMRNLKDIHDGAEVTVRITPEAATFVEITESCSDDVNVIKLHYTPTWRNMGTYTDLHHIINSMYPHATDVRNRDAKLMTYISELLQQIRPLSFS